MESAIQYENNIAALNREIELLKVVKIRNKERIKHLHNTTEFRSGNLKNALEEAKANASDIEEKYKAEFENERERLSEDISVLKVKLLKITNDKLNLEKNIANTVSALNKEILENKTKYEAEVASLISGSNKEKLESAAQYENNLTSLNHELELLKGDESGNKELINHLNKKIEELEGNLKNALEEAKANASDIEEKYKAEFENERER